MDLGRYLQVMRRFKKLLAIGLVIAVGLAIVSVARVGFDGGKPTFDYRQSESYRSAATLLVTQEGFPYGRAVLDDMVEVDGGGPEPMLVPKFGDAGRYSGLAALYAELAKGDAVARQVMEAAKPGEHYTAEVVKDPQTGAALPLIYLVGYGTSAEAAATVAQRATKAFQSYLGSEQAKSDIPPAKRVEVVVTQKASAPEVFSARSFVRPMFLFVLVVMAFLALAFGLENLRSNRARVDAEADWRDTEADWPDAAADADWPDEDANATAGVQSSQSKGARSTHTPARVG